MILFITKQILLPVIAIFIHSIVKNHRIVHIYFYVKFDNQILLFHSYVQKSEKVKIFTQPMSRILQSTDLNIAVASNNVDNIISALKIIFKNATEIADTLNIIFTVPKLTTNQTNYYNVSVEKL